MHKLSANEITQYRQHGYVIPGLTLPAERIDRLRKTMEQLIADNPNVRPEKLVSAHIDGDNGEGVRGHQEFLELAREPQILDIVEQLIGPDVVLWGCHIFCKPAGDGLDTPWHQDGEYWPIRPLATCTVWLALDRSDKGNGCLQVIPDSHRDRELFPHEQQSGDEAVLNFKVADPFCDTDNAVALELEPGQMSMHDVYMIHGANANRSNRRRAGIALRYMPASSLFDRSLRPVNGKSGVSVDFKSRPLWLLRGHDKAGKNDFQVGHRNGLNGLLGAGPD